MTKKIDVSGREIIAQLWDTAGLERFHQTSLGAAFYRGANGCLLVYDINDPQSFDTLNHWRIDVLTKIAGDDDFPIVVVANKLDMIGLEKKSESLGESPLVDPSPSDEVLPEVVSNESTFKSHAPRAVLEWCAQHGYGHIEASAKDSTGVEASMCAIVAKAMESYTRTPRSASQPAQSIDLIDFGNLSSRKSDTCSNCMS